METTQAIGEGLTFEKVWAAIQATNEQIKVALIYSHSNKSVLPKMTDTAAMYFAHCSGVLRQGV